MAQINQDRYETLAARALGVKGAGIFGHAEDAIFAGLALDTNAPIELWYPQRIYRYGAGLEVAGIPGSSGGFELRNTTQDQLWIIEHVNMSNQSGTAHWQLWISEDRTADFYANALLAANLDTRIPGASSQDLGSSGTGLLTPPGYSLIDIGRCPIDTPCIFHPGVILAPGGSFIANSGNSNQTSQFGLSFHTRQAMPGELT